MKELDIQAVKENLPQVLAFVDAELEKLDCGIRMITQIDVAVEEIFVNISSYAYDPEIGPAAIRVEITEEPVSVVISFIDNGKPYDPLAKPDPDMSVPVKRRKIGGLGIFMVKKSMDNVTYEYKNGQNILTIKKNIGEWIHHGDPSLRLQYLLQPIENDLISLMRYGVIFLLELSFQKFIYSLLSLSYHCMNVACRFDKINASVILYKI